MELLRYRKALGDYIKELREEKGLSQLRLLDPDKTGLTFISEKSFSAIENGSEKPRLDTVKQVLSALGTSLDAFEPIYQQRLLQAQIDYQQATDEIGEHIFKGRYLKAKERYEHELAQPETYERALPIVKQKFLLYDSTFLHYLCKDSDQAFQKMVEALLLTRPNEILLQETLLLMLNVKYISSHGFSRTEYQIMVSFANILARSERLADAVLLNAGLISSLKLLLISKELRGRILTMVYFNQSKTLIDAKRYTEAIDLCEEGIEFHLSVKSWRFVGGLYTHQADAFAALGQIEKAHHVFKLAIRQFENDDELEKVEIVKSWFAKNYGMTL